MDPAQLTGAALVLGAGALGYFCARVPASPIVEPPSGDADGASRAGGADSEGTAGTTGTADAAGADETGRGRAIREQLKVRRPCAAMRTFVPHRVEKSEVSVRD